MAEWLVAHQATLQFSAMLAAFAVVAVSESSRPRRALATATTARWLNNLALAAIGGVFVRVAFPVVGVGFALLASQRGWGLLNVVALPAWLSFVVALVAIDLGQYVLHRILHAVPAFWRVHKIHHCDLDVDCVTAIRHHPLEHVLASGAELLVILCLGAPPLAVLASAMLVTAASIFNHGNVVMTPGTDGWLRRFVVTPDMHRIHHSMQHDECNANFSMIFSWWDRLLGTYRDAPRLGQSQMMLGIAEVRQERQVTLWNLLALPFRPSFAVTAARR
jgi:sterol desaturase/sphingolipid hydroxylase (fatty acid hydroxylase superfamily)